jgi:hypothetical protein
MFSVKVRHVESYYFGLIFQPSFRPKTDTLPSLSFLFRPASLLLNRESPLSPTSSPPPATGAPTLCLSAAGLDGRTLPPLTPFDWRPHAALAESPGDPADGQRWWRAEPVLIYSGSAATPCSRILAGPDDQTYQAPRRAQDCKWDSLRDTRIIPHMPA